MKKFLILTALLMISPVVNAQDNVQTTADKVNYTKPYYNQTSANQRTQYAEKNSAVYKKSSGNDYLLKYNIDDLESAPWVNGGKRKL